MPQKDLISSNVDRLVSLINDRGRISYKDAAGKLGIPKSSIEEWAHFLEESGIIDIDYKFMTPFLVKKQLSEDQKKRKVEKFHKERSVFNKKLEAASLYFNELDKKILKITEMFNSMEKHLSGDFKSIEADMVSLNKAEAEKEALDKKIIESKRKTLEKIKEIEQHIREEKISYERSFSQTRTELEQDQQLLDQSLKFLDKVKSEESYLQKRLQEVRDMSHKIETEVQKRANTLEGAEKRIKEVQDKHQKLKHDLTAEQATLQKMVEDNHQQEQKVQKIQEELFKRMEDTEKSLTSKEKDIRDIPLRFKSLIEHKTEIQDLIQLITHEELELKEEVAALQREAKILEYSIGTKEFEKEMATLTEKINKITEKRSFFKTKINEVIKLLDWT